MRDSTTRRRIKKPPKPYRDFPLFPHATRRWAKKIRGRFHYFGPWDDPDGALQKYLDQRDDLHAGRTPRAKAGQLTIRDLCNRFLTAKKQLLDTGELSRPTFLDSHRVCRRMVSFFGPDRPADDLAADDFGAFRVELAKTLGLVALGVEIQRVRSVFRFGYENGLLPTATRYGQSFYKPSRAAVRKLRNGDGARMFASVEMRRMIDAAEPQLRAMILLGIQAGIGNADLGRMPVSALDLEAGWLDYPRGKTGVARRVPLWPETVTALQKAIATRPEPQRKEYAHLAFLTPTGRPWTVPGRDNRLSVAFRHLLEALELYRPRLGFYTLRHVFQTVADGARDSVAVRTIMGHAAPASDMSDVYRERVDDARLRAVVDYVHTWLFRASQTN